MAETFSASISTFAKKLTPVRVDVAVTKIAKELFKGVILRTPVYQGILINNWMPMKNGYNESTTEQKGNAAGAIAKVEAIITPGTFLNKDGFVTMTNSLSYAYRAEYLGWPEKDGWSGRVGPYRMVGLSLTEISARYPV